MMHDEGRRASPPRPYRPTGDRLIVPVDAVEATLTSLRRFGDQESGLFWYGRREGSLSIVTSVRTPRQRMTPFNYRVSAEAMTQMGASLDEELRPLAQVHSHPGWDTEHSSYDDEMASSRRALSLVFPHYGRLHAAWPEGVGVHEWQIDYWQRLSTAETRNRITLGERAGVERSDFR